MTDKNQKPTSKLVYSGAVSRQVEGQKESEKIGGIRLFEVNSTNEKAPALSGEVRILDRIYRVAVWRQEE